MADNGKNDGNGNAHSVTRVLQVLTLIPCWALLAAVVAEYNKSNAKTPGDINFLFVIAILASVWSFCILITYLRAKNTALWMTFFDVIALALFIAAVVVLSDIANVRCINVTPVVVNNPNVNNPNIQYYPTTKRQAIVVDPNATRTDGPYTYRRRCGEIKGAWGLAIANIILFFISAILTVVIWRQNQTPIVREKIIIDPPVQHMPPRPMHQAPLQMPPQAYGNPYAVGGEPPRRHSKRDRRSHRSSHSRSHRSDRGGSHYEGSSRRGSRSDNY